MGPLVAWGVDLPDRAGDPALKGTGGYVPAPRRRREGSLTLAEREEISRGLARGESMRSIARRLGRSPSTISREIGRSKGPGKYRAVDADDLA